MSRAFDEKVLSWGRPGSGNSRFRTCHPRVSTAPSPTLPRFAGERAGPGLRLIVPNALPGHNPRMIRIDKISKQNGHQIVFIEASAVILKGEKVGLVGPNGAGKTTLFRMIAGEENPDEGQVSVDRGTTIGYFSQDVGEMAGRSAVAEVMNGAGPVSEVLAEMKALEAAMADPDRADEMDEIIESYGEVQARFAVFC